MSTNILGISAFYHDSAAALVRDGEIVAAAQEERFSRKKHDPRFPINAINYCLEEAFIEAGDLDAIVFYDNPVATFDRVLRNALSVGPDARGQFQKAA
jgi:carbamoyltransferase